MGQNEREKCKNCGSLETDIKFNECSQFIVCRGCGSILYKITF